MKLKNRLKALSYSIALSSMLLTTGCTSSNNFSYSNNADGEVVVEGSIDYELLKNYKLIEVKLLNGEHKLFIVSQRNVYYDRAYKVYDCDYYDVCSSKKIYSTMTGKNETESSIELVKEYDLTAYLITYDEIKASYTIDDIERILNKINEDYQFENEKKLEK